LSNNSSQIFFFSTLSEFENFLLCERILINVTNCQNVKLILKILSDLELLRGSSSQKTLYSTRSCVNWASFHSRFKPAHSCQKNPNLHKNSSNKLLLNHAKDSFSYFLISIYLKTITSRKIAFFALIKKKYSRRFS
jgi:hypothetical protein